jgi:hypothetical protein
MSESAIRAQIKVILESIPDIGNVYSVRKYYNTQADRLAIMKTSISGVEQIRTWMIYRDGLPESNQILLGLGADKGREIIHKYIIEGWIGLKDADSTELTLNSLLDSIEKAFATNRTLNDTCFYHDGIIIDKIDVVDMTGILCNHCELSLRVREFI